MIITGSLLQKAENSILATKSTKKTNLELKKQHASKRQRQHQRQRQRQRQPQTNKDMGEENEEGSKSRKKQTHKERMEKESNAKNKKTIPRVSEDPTKHTKQSGIQPSFQNPIPLLPRKQVYLFCCHCEL